MKILIVNKFLYPNGGSETYIFKIGQQLEKMGHEVQYFGMEHVGRIVGNHAESYTADMNFHSGKPGRIMYPFKIVYSNEARKKIRSVLDDFEPDAVHLNNINFQLTPSIIDEIDLYRKQRSSKLKIIYTAHDYQWVCPNHMLMIPATGAMCSKCIDGDYKNCFKNRCIHESKLRSLLGMLEAVLYQKRKTYTRVDTVICPSRFMERVLSHNKQLADKLIVMHNFLEPDIRGNCVGQNRDSDYVLYFGRYDRQKGISTLLKACKKLPDIHFVFAGKGELENEVDQITNIDNKGFLSGEMLHDLIRNARFTVFPSEWYENCPFSVMESQTHGTPIIASDLGGTAELLLPGVTGDLFRGKDEEQLEKAIRNLWNDKEKCDRYREACKDYAQLCRLDTLPSYCSKLEELYGQDDRR